MKLLFLLQLRVLSSIKCCVLSGVIILTVQRNKGATTGNVKTFRPMSMLKPEPATSLPGHLQIPSTSQQSEKRLHVL